MFFIYFSGFKYILAFFDQLRFFIAFLKLYLNLMIVGSFYCNSEFVRVMKLSRLLEILLLLVQIEKVIDFFCD